MKVEKKLKTFYILGYLLKLPMKIWRFGERDRVRNKADGYSCIP